MDLASVNPNQPTTASLTSPAVRSSPANALLGLVFCLISAAYFYAAIAKSRSTDLWLDEILSVSAARLASPTQIWLAIKNGSDFNPPAYDLLLHFFTRAVGAHGHLVWRIPSILAVYGAALTTYALVRKHLTPLVALLAFGLVLDSELFDFADQARQYALLAFGLALALWLWNNFPQTRFPKLQIFALWLTLSVCLCLHFYGVIEVAAIGVAEILWWLSRRQFRPGIWLALLLTIPVEAAWVPLAAHLASFNRANIVSPEFFARPTVTSFINTIYEVMLAARNGSLLFLAGLTLIGLAALLQRSGAARRSAIGPWLHEDLPAADRPEFTLSRLEIIMLSLFSLPFITFVFSVVVTKAFATRYTIGAALLFAIGPAVMLNYLPSRRLVALLLLPLLLGTLISRAHTPNPIISVPITNALRILQTPRPAGPVVVGEAMLYIELMEAADPETRSNLVYLRRPQDAPNPDPTDENLVISLATFHPEYRVYDPAAFLAQNRNFYLITLPGASIDTTTPSLVQHGLIGGLVNEQGDAELFRAASAVSD